MSFCLNFFFLQFLVLKNESIKKKESDFKQACKVEMAELNERNQNLAAKLKGISGKDSKVL